MNYVRSGMKRFGGVLPTVLENRPDGSFDLAEIKEAVKNPPISKITGITVESPHNIGFGTVARFPYIADIKEIA